MDATASEQPVDRLTRMCDVMTQTFDAHPEHREGDRCIVFISDDERGGIVVHGYEDHGAAMAELLLHMRAMFRAQGKTLDLIFMDDDGVNTV